MTREEFIDGYISRSGLEAYRTEDGFAFEDGRGSVALPCCCHEEGCDGWAMVANDPASVRTHLFFYGPDEGRPETPAARDTKKEG